MLILEGSAKDLQDRIRKARPTREMVGLGFFYTVMVAYFVFAAMSAMGHLN
jgi:uncharacterized PurR-regulated membrane protein YhhQ (DUF165 family)